MAKLILTEKEKEIASWLDMPDEELGKRLRQSFVNIGNILEKEKFSHDSIALHLACESAKQNAKVTTYIMNGVTFKDKELGNWKVTVEKIN